MAESRRELKCLHKRRRRGIGCVSRRLVGESETRNDGLFGLRAVYRTASDGNEFGRWNMIGECNEVTGVFVWFS